MSAKEERVARPEGMARPGSVDSKRRMVVSKLDSVAS